MAEMECMEARKECMQEAARGQEAEAVRTGETVEAVEADMSSVSNGICAREQRDAIDEHRAALRKMRASAALKQMIADSGARNCGFVEKLLDIDMRSVSFDEDGVPDLRFAHERLRSLRDSDGYLFADCKDTSAPAYQTASAHAPVYHMPGGSVTGITYQPTAVVDENLLSDADYYRLRRQRRSSGRR